MRSIARPASLLVVDAVIVETEFSRIFDIRTRILLLLMLRKLAS